MDNSIKALKVIIKKFDKNNHLYKIKNTILGKIFETKLRLCSYKSSIKNHEPNLIVSLTSYPKRIDKVWLTIESIFQQEVKPARIVLVLVRSEFRDLNLPKSLKTLEKKGLEILWVDEEIRSYNKYIPVAKKYPNESIITIDDDLMYEKWRLKKLLSASKKNPRHIIGFRGWEVSYSDNSIKPYNDWVPATKNTLSTRVFLTGCGGIIYPPHLLNPSLLFNMTEAVKLAPTADDVWFWGVTLASNVKPLCLGIHSHIEIDINSSSSGLQFLNCGECHNDSQILSVINKFSLNHIISDEGE